MEAEITFPAFRCVKGDNGVSGLDRLNATSDFNHDAGAFVSENRGKCTLRIISRERKGVGMTNSGGLYFDQDFPSFRSLQVDFDDLEGFTCGKRYSGTGFHGVVLLVLGWFNSMPTPSIGSQ
jgi:hypothetical protein